MDIDERIRRRQRVRADRRLVLDYDYLSPVSHISEPVDRGPLVERLLDHVEPAFGGSLPTNGYLWGPKGTGKSAVVSVLFDRLASLSLQTGSVIHTTTRAEQTSAPAFVYVDARKTDSKFSLYRDVLDELVEESIPKQGVGTDWMRDRLATALDRVRPGAVLAVDHADESAGEGGSPVEAFDAFENVAWLAVGRDSPAETDLPPVDADFEVTPYQDKVLLDVLMTRASVGLPGDSLDHGGARRIAAWAEGDAHDALAALLSAADVAATEGRTHIDEDDVAQGIESVPRPCVSLARIDVLPDNRKAVLRALVEMDESDRASVTQAASAIAEGDGIDLSFGTVKRFLYQLADVGVIDRVPQRNTSGKGRPPSRVEPRFPTRAFRRLYDAA